MLPTEDPPVEMISAHWKLLSLEHLLVHAALARLPRLRPELGGTLRAAVSAIALAYCRKMTASVVLTQSSIVMLVAELAQLDSQYRVAALDLMQQELFLLQLVPSKLINETV